MRKKWCIHSYHPESGNMFSWCTILGYWNFILSVFQNSTVNSPYSKTKPLLYREPRNTQLFFLCTLYLFCILDIATLRNLQSLEQDLSPVAVSLEFRTHLIWKSCYFFPDLFFCKHFSLYKAFFQLFIF